MKILLSTDGSTGALDAARFLAGLVHRRDIHLHIFTVLKEDSNEGDLRENEQEFSFASTRQALGDFPGHVTTGCTRTRCSTSRIVERIQVSAELLSADLIVIGWRGRSQILNFFAGSVALGVVRHSPCSVLLGRAPNGPLSRVVVGLDDSEDAPRIVHFLQSLPLPPTCTIHLVSVAMPDAVVIHSGALLPAKLRHEITAIVHEEQTQGQRRLANSADILRSAGWIVTTEQRYGDPATELLEAADGDPENRADLLIVGAYGENTEEHYLYGSVSARVIERAQCSVLIVRRR